MGGAIGMDMIRQLAVHGLVAGHHVPAQLALAVLPAWRPGQDRDGYTRAVHAGARGLGLLVDVVRAWSRPWRNARGPVILAGSGAVLAGRPRLELVDLEHAAAWAERQVQRGGPVAHATVHLEPILCRVRVDAHGCVIRAGELLGHVLPGRAAP